MANLVLRYSLYSVKEEIDIIEIAKRLPKENVKGIYRLGEKKGKYFSKEHAVDYIYRYQNINSVSDICRIFFNDWQQYSSIVKELHLNGFESHLLFEFDIFDSNFPEFYYENKFLSFLANIGAELQLYFYTGSSSR